MFKAAERRVHMPGLTLRRHTPGFVEAREIPASDMRQSPSGAPKRQAGRGRRANAALHQRSVGSRPF